MSKIVLLSNDALLSRLFNSAAKHLEMDTVVNNTLEQGIEIIKKQGSDAILISIPLSVESCPNKIIHTLQKVNPYISVFVLIDQLDVSIAISLGVLGADYFSSRPVVLEMITDNIKKTIPGLSKPCFNVSP